MAAERNAVDADASRRAADGSVRSLSAAARALETEVDTARDVDTLEEQLGDAGLAELDAQIETARRRVDGVELRAQLWADLAEQRAALGPPDLDGDHLRRLELDLLRTELAEAEARLAALDAEAGNGLVRAQSAGRVDRLFVAAGAVVEAQEPLVSYYDPSAVWITAYATPGVAGKLRAGQGCAVVPEGTDHTLSASVAHLASSWTACPDALRRRLGGTTDLRLPVRIDCVVGDRVVLHPDMRVKITFAAVPDERQAGARAGG